MDAGTEGALIRTADKATPRNLLRQWVVRLLALLVLPAQAQSPEPLAAGLSCEPTRLELGMTHAQFSLDGRGDQAAIAAARQLVPHVGRYQNLFIMGWGLLNPEPARGQYEWSTLDRRMSMIRETGGIPVVSLCCAPDWMKGGAQGQTDWRRLEVAPNRAHFADFAELARQVALRYPDVRHYQVWNEFKGFWLAEQNRWDYEGYTELFNLVYRALKSVSPAIQVGGPYIVFQPWLHPPPEADQAVLRGGYGVVDRRAMEAFDFWNTHKVGADFIAVDGTIEARDGAAADRLASTRLFADVGEWLRQRSDLPIWWAEWYAAPWEAPQEQQNVLMAAALLRMLPHASVALRWSPQGDAGRSPSGAQESLWTDTRLPGGGQPFSAAVTMMALRHCLPAGSCFRQIGSAGNDVLGAIGANCSLLLNGSAYRREVQLDGQVIDLPPWTVRTAYRPPPGP